MLISEYKALFVHVPKAAGQSVEDFLLNTLHKNRKENGSEYLLRYNGDPLKGPERLAHLTALDYVKYEYISDELFKEYYKFSIIRNPWSRMFSFYKFRGYSNLMSFSNFISHHLPYCFENEHWFFRPQSDFIYDHNDVLLVDFVGKMEDINIDFSVIANNLNIKFNTLPRNNHSVSKGLISRKSLHLIKEQPSVLKHINFMPSKYSNYKVAYTDKTLLIVKKYYERDIDLLKYTF